MKKIIINICISLIVQTIILFCISRFYVSKKIDFKFTNITENKKEQQFVEVSIPNECKNLLVSPTSNYLTYTLNGEIYSINLKNGQRNTLDLDTSKNDYSMVWHDSNDTIIISEKLKSNNSLKMYIYYANTNKLESALDYNNQSKLYKLSRYDETVAELKLNTLNTISYIKTKYKDSTYLNRLDISESLNRLNLTSNNIGTFFIIKSIDELIYEDLNSNDIYITNKSKFNKVNLNVDYSLKLFHVDSDENIYIAGIKDDKVKIIYYKNIDTISNTQWSTIEVPDYTKYSLIKILSKDDIFAISNNEVLNIKTNKKINFDGKFLDIVNGYVLSLVDNKISYTNIS